MAQRADRKVLVVLSDTHAGHKLGLMPPDVVLYDEDEEGTRIPYTPSQTASQRYLWGLYCEYMQRTVEIARGAPLVVIHNGDLTQGNKYISQQVATDAGHQMLIAIANLTPWLGIKNVQAVRIVAGTQSHEFYDGTAAQLVTRALQLAAPRKDIQMLNHGLLQVGGVAVDYAHHGPQPGSREWLRGNVARFYLRDLMMREIVRGQVPPRLVFRSHYHTWVREHLEWGGHEADLIITPSYCMLGDHARQVAQSPHLLGNGHVVVEIEGGQVREIHKLLRTVDLRTKEEL